MDGRYNGTSDLQLERMNVYFNEVLSLQVGPAVCQGRMLMRDAGLRQQVCSACSPRRSRARHHGCYSCRPMRSALPSRQLRLRSVGCRQQLGQGPLHRMYIRDLAWVAHPCCSKRMNLRVRRVPRCLEDNGKRNRHPPCFSRDYTTQRFVVAHELKITNSPLVPSFSSLSIRLLCSLPLSCRLPCSTFWTFSFARDAFLRTILRLSLAIYTQTTPLYAAM